MQPSLALVPAPLFRFEMTLCCVVHVCFMLTDSSDGLASASEQLTLQLCLLYPAPRALWNAWSP